MGNGGFDKRHTTGKSDCLEVPKTKNVCWVKGGGAESLLPIKGREKRTKGKTRRTIGRPTIILNCGNLLTRQNWNQKLKPTPTEGEKRAAGGFHEHLTWQNLQKGGGQGNRGRGLSGFGVGGVGAHETGTQNAETTSSRVLGSGSSGDMMRDHVEGGEKKSESERVGGKG